MAKNAKSLKVAKALLLTSIDGEGRVDEQKIKEILKEFGIIKAAKFCT